MFKLFKKKESSRAALKLSPAVAESILGTLGTRSIPAMPASAQKAFKLSIDPNAEAHDFIQVIESDEALSARVLRIANSVFYDRGNRSTTIEEAVNVIGINELRCLLNANTLSEIFPSRNPARRQLWANDIATALTARTLAQRSCPNKTDVAFLAGLMHDLGKLLMLQRQEDVYGKILTKVESSGVDIIEAEEEIFPFNHTQVGQLVAERWNFSDEIQLVISKHHKSWEELSGESSPLPAITKGADILAHALGLGHSRSCNRLRLANAEMLPGVWQALNIQNSEQQPLLDSLKRTFELEYDLYAGNS